MTTKAIAYLRVSTDKQADKGMSLEVQRAKILTYAQLYDIELVDIIEDAGESAKTINRPGLNRALEMLRKKKAAALIVVKLDRLTRTVADLGHLVDKYFSSGKLSLLAVNEQIDTRTATGRMMINMIATLSQWERETVGERTKEAMAHKKAKGEYTGGGIPYGFTVVNGVLVPNAFEQSIIARAKQLRAIGTSLRKIAAQFSLDGILSRIGRLFDPTQIVRLCAA